MVRARDCSCLIRTGRGEWDVEGRMRLAVAATSPDHDTYKYGAMAYLIWNGGMLNDTVSKCIFLSENGI